MEAQEFHEDLRGYGISQLLPIDEDQAMLGVEEDALQYLKRVREEAARIPVVISSEIDARAFDDNRTTSYLSAQADDDAEDLQRPPYTWMCKVVDDFIEARAQVAQEASSSAPSATKLPPVSDTQAWCRLMSQEHFQPFSATLARMNHSLVVHCLSHLTDVMQTRQAAGGHISPHTGLWIYGLLVRLEKPLHSRLAATIRQVSQMARKLRPRGDEHAVGSQESALVPVYDTLLVLAGGFFGQDAALAPLVDEYICLHHGA